MTFSPTLLKRIDDTKSQNPTLYNAMNEKTITIPIGVY